MIIVLAAILFLAGLFVEGIPDPDPLEYDEEWEDD